MSYKKYKKKILLIILGVSFIVPIWTAIAKLNFQAYRYRSFFCVLPIFIIGFCIYFFKTNQPKERKSKYIFLIFLYVSCMFIKPNEVSEVIIWILFIIQIVITIELSKLNMRRDTKSYKIDRYLGNLSYGIFLGQSVSAYIYFNMIEKNDLKWGMDILGEPYSLKSGLIILLFTIIMSMATYQLIEVPIGKVRDVIRNR